MAELFYVADALPLLLLRLTYCTDYSDALNSKRSRADIPMYYLSPKVLLKVIKPLLLRPKKYRRWVLQQIVNPLTPESLLC